ncbi:MAG: PAAR domain-containing protein [Roseiarcus sp.]
MMRSTVALLSLVLATAVARAHSAPGAVAGGSLDTLVGGKPAARTGDAASGGPVLQGSPDVFINGKPAVTSGDRSACAGAVVAGSASMFVNGKPLAAAGDPTSGCSR